MYFLGLGEGKIVTRSPSLPSPQAMSRKQRANPSKSFSVARFQNSLSEKKEEGTKPSASIATSSSQRADILMENLLVLVTFKLLSAGHLKPHLSFLVLNFIELYLSV